ncbi:MAG: YtxH domain-containing protein [Tenericutes bacterium]|nr:YtxH domain-containing protein [Mycoplasmatota bacterium]
MSKKGTGKFVLGAAIGAGLGLLFAPKEGRKLREELKNKLSDLLDQASEIDMEDVKKQFDKKVEEIKKELADLDKEKALDIAKKKADELKKKVQELADLAVEKGTPVLDETAKEVKTKANAVIKDVLKKLEEKTAE